MPLFEYQATDADGNAVRGTMVSGSLGLAAEDLARRGLTVTQLANASAPLEDARPAERAAHELLHEPPPTEPRPAVMTELIGPLVNKVPLSHQLFFFRQLGTMLHAGVGMVQTLDTLSTQSSDPRLRAIIREMRDHALEGRPISAGMQRYPEVFSPLVLSLVRVGERGGILEQTCKQIAHYLEREIELRNLLRRVTIYPKLVLAASIVIVLGTNAFIASMGRSGGLSSPLTEPATWIVLGPLIIGLFLFTRIGLQNPRVKSNYEQMLLLIPGLGKTVRQFAMAKFGRAFGALYKGGVAPTEALKLAADACGNESMRARIYPAVRDIESGGTLTDAMARTGVFSPLVLDMVSTGERTGNVDSMLEKVAEFYEDEAQTRSYQFGMAFGVVVLLCVAIYVAYVVIKFYTGYFAGITGVME